MNTLRRGCCIMLVILGVLLPCTVRSQNPIIRDQFSADPSARVFGDRVYVYPSHDILASAGRGRVGWFCMEDYHVFSSSNLVDWTDHGVIVRQDSVPWVNPKGFAMWAPDAIARGGKFYFYFPAVVKDTSYGRGFGVGVAVADRPEGPFTPKPEPIRGVRGIDPNPFIDRDGQAYLYWSGGNIFMAPLKENMTELAAPPKSLEGLPGKGLKEGPYMLERNGIYYLTYPHVQDSTEQLEYAIADNPRGPFKVTGVIMEAKPGCWTNHHSIVEIRGQWYLFYHHNDLSPKFDKARSVRIDSLFFNPDGTIRTVTPTLRGVGVTEATREIQIDRYSSRSDHGTHVALLDTTNSFKGWKTLFDLPGAWLQYNSVQWGTHPLHRVTLRVGAADGGVVQLRWDGAEGPVIADVEIPQGDSWRDVTASVAATPRGVHHLFVRLTRGTGVAVDWVRFE